MTATCSHFMQILTPSPLPQGVAGGVENHPLLSLSPPPLPPHINADTLMHTLHTFYLHWRWPPPHDPPCFCAIMNSLSMLADSGSTHHNNGNMGSSIISLLLHSSQCKPEHSSYWCSIFSWKVDTKFFSVKMSLHCLLILGSAAYSSELNHQYTKSCPAGIWRNVVYTRNFLIWTGYTSPFWLTRVSL